MRRQSRATRRYCSALLVTTVVARRIENSIAPPSDLLTPPSPSAKADRPARQHQGPEVVGKSVRASSIRAIAIMTNAVETNRILGSPPSWCVMPPCLSNCVESVSSQLY